MKGPKRYNPVMTRRRDGQALAELMIGLVVFMVLLAGIIQMGSLGVRHSRVMDRARRDAAVEALSDLPPLAGPDYMADRTEGNDGVRYSRDDGFLAGDLDGFQNGIVDHADPDTLELRRRGNIVSEVAGSPFPHLLFGLVDGRADATVELWPVVRHLLYDAESIELEGHAWLIWTRGVY